MRPIYFTLLFVGFTYVLNSQLTPAVIDSLELRLQNTQENIKKVDIMNDLSIRYYRVSVEREREYAYKALALSREIEYLKGEAVALKNMGVVQRTSGAPIDSILTYYHASLALAERHDLKDLKIALYNNLGRAFGEYAQYNKALSYLLKCMELEQEYPQASWKRALIIANVGTLYYQLKDYQKASEYLDKSYAMAESLGNYHINMMHIDDRALTQYRLGNIVNAQNLIIESLDTLKKERDYESLYQSILALIEIRIEENQLRSAEKLAHTMMKELEIHHLPLYECILHNRIAEIKIALNKGAEALNYSLKSLSCGEVTSSNIIKTDALKQLYQAYKLVGNLPMMDSTHDEYVRAADLEIERQKNIAISEEEFKYEKQLKQQEILLLQEKQRISDRLLNVFIFGIIGLLLLSVTAIYSYIKRNKIANDLSKKNKALTKAEYVLEEKNKMLEKYIESNIKLSQFAHIASHDLKSPLRTVSSFVGLAKNSAKDRLTDKEKEYMSMSLDATKDMFNLVEDLLSFSKVNALELQLEDIDMNSLFNEALAHLSYAINENNGKIDICSDNVIISGDKTKLRQVIENLLSNALKFVPEGVAPHIKLSCSMRENDFLFQISDNGIGIDKKYASQVFEPFKQLNSKDEYSGTGLGLALCKEIVEKHQGYIWIESEVGVGTDIFFTIKKGLINHESIDTEIQPQLNSLTV